MRARQVQVAQRLPRVQVPQPRSTALSLAQARWSRTSRASGQLQEGDGLAARRLKRAMRASNGQWRVSRRRARRDAPLSRRREPLPAAQLASASWRLRKTMRQSRTSAAASGSGSVAPPSPPPPPCAAAGAPKTVQAERERRARSAPPNSASYAARHAAGVDAAARARRAGGGEGRQGAAVSQARQQPGQHVGGQRQQRERGAVAGRGRSAAAGCAAAAAARMPAISRRAPFALPHAAR